jgi:hypothetical protein
MCPISLRMYENGKKQAVLCSFWLINYQKLRVSLKRTEQDIHLRFFLGILFINFCCYLRRCEVVPVQNFGSHIRPQSPGLEFNVNLVILNILTVHAHTVYSNTNT